MEHRGAQILYIDVSNCGIDEIFETMRDAEQKIRSQPEGSVLTLTNVAGARYSKDLIKSVKDFVLANKPYVTKSAVVGVEGLQRIVLDGIRVSTGREFESSDNLEEAKAYLVG
jgi:hypothetical protein